MNARASLAIVGAALVTAFFLARPASALACAGCGVPMSDFVHEVSALFVATSDGSIAPHTYRLTVGPRLLGTVPALVTYRAVGGEPAMPPGSRWIIAISPVDRAALRTATLDGRWNAAWSVAPDGRIELGQVLAPPTLSGFLAWFSLPATDSEAVPVGQGPPVALVMTLAAGLVWLALWRRPWHGCGDDKPISR